MNAMHSNTARRVTHLISRNPAPLATPQALAETLNRRATESFVHRASLALVWLAIASGAFVFTEPAPTDLLTIGLIVLLPVVGLTAIRPPFALLGGTLVSICAFGFISALAASDAAKSTTHMAISLYLSLAAVIIAAFVARNPERHTRLILNAQLAGALFAAAAGLIGYFDFVPGTADLFTKFGRASGTFKDPNVFGPYLVPAIVYLLHIWLHRPLIRGLPAALGLVVLSFAVLLSFSRGAWAGAAIAILIYLYVTFVTSPRMIDRVRIGALAIVGTISLLTVFAAATQFDAVAELLSQRASLAQSYDVGPEGRFGGQLKAFDVLLGHPFGIGALSFPDAYHSEDVHNVYLSMFLNAGWLGGLLFIALALVTLTRGLRRAFLRTPIQSYYLIAYSALAATFLQGLLVDIDHWRHFYILLGLVWALMVTGRTRKREVRIVSDVRPLLLKPVIMLPPPTRKARIICTIPAVIELLPRRQRHMGEFNRMPRINGPVTLRRMPRLRLIHNAPSLRLATTCKDE